MARQGFENQLVQYPDSAEVPNALYWRARAAEEEHNPAMARAFYQKLSERFHNYYYAEFARQRLKTLPGVDASAEIAAKDIAKNVAPQAALTEVAANKDAPKQDPGKAGAPVQDLSKGDPEQADPGYYALLDHVSALSSKGAVEADRTSRRQSSRRASSASLQRRSR